MIFVVLLLTNPDAPDENLVCEIFCGASGSALVYVRDAVPPILPESKTLQAAARAYAL